MIENKEIHNGLNNKEIRDYLGKELYKLQMSGGWSNVEFIEKQIRELTQTLELCKQYNAIKKIIEMNKWKDFDVSEITSYNSNYYQYFIGTEKEFEKFESKYNEYVEE
jgi:hypothetical protein